MSEEIRPFTCNLVVPSQRLVTRDETKAVNNLAGFLDDFLEKPEGSGCSKEDKKDKGKEKEKEVDRPVLHYQPSYHGKKELRLDCRSGPIL